MKMNKYRVQLWPGAGYWLKSVEVEARDEEDALIQASLEIGEFIPEDEADDDIREAEEQYCYIDRTEYDSGIGYLLIENAYVAQI